MTNTSTISALDTTWIAELSRLKGQSHDPDRPVGALIVDSQGNLISSGVNAPPIRLGLTVEQTRRAIEHDPAWKYYVIEHAERSAILAALLAGKDLRGATMYGSLFPCADCARSIVAVGIKRLVVPAPGLHTIRDERWLDHYKYAREILDRAGIQVDHF